MCETHDIYGFQKDVADGGMAEYMRFSERAIIHKIPESLSEEDAALIEPMACAIHTVRRGDIELDDVVVIAGAGPLGLCMVQVAHLKTPKKLVVIDTMDDRGAGESVWRRRGHQCGARGRHRYRKIHDRWLRLRCVYRSDGRPYRRDPWSGDDS